jgi:hypothetical protein
MYALPEPEASTIHRWQVKVWRKLAGLWPTSEMKVPFNHLPAVRVIVIALSAHSIPLSLEEMMVLIADRLDFCRGISTSFIEMAQATTFSTGWPLYCAPHAYVSIIVGQIARHATQ